jgi:hypothetical protein
VPALRIAAAVAPNDSVRVQTEVALGVVERLAQRPGMERMDG